MKTNVNDKQIILLIICIASLPQLSETIYSPALPNVATTFGVGARLIEYTLTIFLYGFALGILLWGNVSDQIGRKKALAIGFMIFSLGCLGCWFAQSIKTLYLFGFLQAFGASSGSVLAQTITRDMFIGTKRQKVFGIVTIAMAFAPALGLLIGSLIDTLFGWRAVFLLLIASSLSLILSIYHFLPETLHTPLPSHALARLSSAARLLFRDRYALALGWLVGSANGLMFGLYAEAPFYFTRMLNISSRTFGYMAFFTLIPLLFGGILNMALLKRHWSGAKIISLGVFLITTGTVFLYTFTLLQFINPSNPPLAIFLADICILVCIFGLSLIIPNALSQALNNYKHMAGAASSCFGFYYYAVTATLNFVMSRLHDGSMNALPKFFILVAIGMVIAYLLSTPQPIYDNWELEKE